VSGRVYAPNGLDPLVNVLVYVPNGVVEPFVPGVTCDNCGASASGAPLVTAVSGVDGSFTLKNAPVGNNIPLVIQVGRWRRQVTIPTVTACQNTVVARDLTRLPKNHLEGDIPLMAFSTGSVDGLECVMRKIGVDDSEFSGPDGNGRIQLYVGVGAGVSSASHGPTVNGGASYPGDYVTEDNLWTELATLQQYDLVLFACQGWASTRPAAAQQNLVDYASAGGRLYVTHLGYNWLYENMPFETTADWDVNPNAVLVDQTGYIDQSFPKGAALAQWLQGLDPTQTLGQIPLYALRKDLDGIVPALAQQWMTVNDPSAVMHYTFNTPVGAPSAQQCGRVLFDDYHVEDYDPEDTDPYNPSVATNGKTFPAECLDTDMTLQEKLLEFMIFDLSSCVTSDTPVCVPTTCGNVKCGQAGDGCGNILDCGTCPAGETCGGGGVPSVCGAPSCTPSTCAQLLVECGQVGDGCGGLLQCGDCPDGQTCGGGGKPGVCGQETCTPRTCAELGVACGPSGDGCGGSLQCGACPQGQTCGGGGTPNVCGGVICTPKTCAQLGADCGPVADGCSGIVECGTCSLPEICGGGGTPNVCGGSTSTPH
jgi:hypothetical protein